MVLEQQLSRRRLVQLSGSVAVLASLGLMAACGDDDDESTSLPTSTATAPPEAESTEEQSEPTATDEATMGAPVPTGELRVAATADSYRTEPNRSNIGMFPLNTNIFETLVRILPDYQVEPMLAESWEFIEPNTWRFVLRDDVTFHDGTPLTSEAVAWSMTRVAASGGGILAIGEESVAIIDDHTVEITPVRPNLRVVQQIGHPSYSICAPNSEPADVRIGTGPFREVEYAREERYIVEWNPDYWGDPPGVEKISFRFMPDATTRMLALQSGEVDLAIEIAREATVGLTEASGLSLVTSTVGAYEALYVNIHGDEPYDLGRHPEVREAIAYAIDKESIVTGVWQGNAEVSNTFIPQAILGPSGDRIQGTDYNPDHAREVLEESGWIAESDGIREKDGRRLSLTMIVGFPTAEIHGPMPEFVQAQLADVGIEASIVITPDLATYEARLQTGEGDLWAEAGNQNDANPCFLPDLLFSSPVPDGDDEQNMYANAFSAGPEFDEFIDACREAVSVEDVQDAAASAMQLLIDEEFIVIPLAGTFRIYGTSDKVAGFEAHPSGANQRWTSVAIVSE